MLCAPLKVHELVVDRGAEHLGVAVDEFVVQLAEGGDFGRAHEGEVLRPEENYPPLAFEVATGDRGEVILGLLCVDLREVATDQRREPVGRELVTNSQQCHVAPPLKLDLVQKSTATILPEPHFERKVIFPTTLIGMTDKSYQPTIAGLRAFVAVAEKQHFGSAATTLGVSQSTLSQALSALENGLGVQLIERSTRRVFLTTEGSQLLPQAQAVIQAADASSAAAAGSSDPLRAGIRLGLIPTVAPYVLPTILAGLAEELPELT